MSEIALGTPIEVARSLEYVVFEMTRSRDVVRVTKTWRQLSEDLNDSLFDISPDVKFEVFMRGDKNKKIVYYSTFDSLEKANQFYDEIFFKIVNILSAIHIFEELNEEDE